MYIVPKIGKISHIKTIFLSQSSQFANVLFRTSYAASALFGATLADNQLWEDYCLVLETLEEKAPHLIHQVLGRVAALSSDSGASGDRRLHHADSVASGGRSLHHAAISRQSDCAVCISDFVMYVYQNFEVRMSEYAI